MAPPKGNTFWKRRSFSGRKLKFDSPDDLWEKAVAYFEWADDNPLEENKCFCNQGVIVNGTVSKKRPYTLNAFCHHMNVGGSTLADYRRKDNFSAVIAHIDSIIYDNKFIGASVGFFNPNIIARDLGLIDKVASEVKSTNVNIDTKMDPKEAAAAYSQMIKNS